MTLQDKVIYPCFVYVALSVFFLTEVWLANGKVLEHRARAHFLSLGSRSRGKFSQLSRVNGSSADEMETHNLDLGKALAFDEPVIPPPPVRQAPLQAVDGAVLDEIQKSDGIKSVRYHPPVMLTQVVELWEFLIWLCGSIALAVVGIVMQQLWSRHGVLEQQAVKLQFILVLALLITCPASRAIMNSYHDRPLWVIAIRNLLEMWLMLLAFGAIPYMSLDFVSRCCSQGMQEMNAVSLDGKFKLTPEARQQVAMKTQCHLLTATDWHWHSDMEAVRRVQNRMAAVLLLRPVLAVARSSHFGAAECWQTAAICAAASFLLLLTAVVLGIRNLTPVTQTLARALGMQPIILSLQRALCALLMIAQAQDFVFLIVYGSEKLAQVFAGALFMAEIVAALLHTGVFMTTDPLMEMVEYRVPNVRTPFIQRFKLLLKPYPFLEGKASDPAVSLKVRPLPGPVVPVFVKEQPEFVKRNIWQYVLTDIFTDKVRCKGFAVTLLSSFMAQCLFEWQDFQAKFPEYGTVLSVWLFCFGGWVVTSVLLLGNNIYLSKWLLVIPILILPMPISYNLITFGSVTAEEQKSVAHCWTKLFCSALEVTALLLCLRTFFSTKGAADFYASQRASHRYTSVMLEKVDNGRHHATHAKNLKKAAAFFPPLLLVGLAATIPVVLAFALVAVHQGLVVIRYARVGQVYFQAILKLPDLEKTMQDFRALDRDMDLKLYPSEAGLQSVLGLLGPYMEKIIVPMNTLWASVTAHGPGTLGWTTFIAVHNPNGRRFSEEKEVLTEGERLLAAGESRWLGPEEFHSFLCIMHKTVAVFRSLVHADDLALGVQSLWEKLDVNKDGDVDLHEFPIYVMALASQCLSPHLSHLIAPKLSLAWHKADTDHDGKLSAEEFPDFLLDIKKRAMQLQKSVQELVVALILNGIFGSVLGPSHGPDLASAPASAGEMASEDDAGSIAHTTSKADDAAVLQVSWHHHRELRKNRQHRKVSDPAAFQVAEQESTTASVPAPAPATKPAAGFIPGPALSDPDYIIKILTESTASLGEAFSLLLVAVNAILPEHVLAAEKLLTLAADGDLSVELAHVAQERWQSRYAISIAWMQEDIERLRTGLSSLMEMATPWLRAAAARAKVFLLAIGQVAGSSLDDDRGPSLDNAFAELDTEPEDGKLSFGETGFHAALALINPALASNAQTFFNWALGEGLDKARFGKALQFFSQIIAEYIYDFNGDGDTDEEDVKEVAFFYASQLDLLLQEPPVSFMQTWKATKLRKVVQPGYGVEVPPEAVPVADHILKWMVRLFVTLEIDRIEASLYAAALLSFAFGAFVVAMPLFGYSRLYARLQAGDRTFKGGTSIGTLRGYVDYATAYPGTLFSTVFMGVFVVFTILFAVFSFLSVPRLYLPLLMRMKETIFYILLAVVLRQLVKYVVLDKVCLLDGEIVNPRLYSCVYVMLIIMNFAVGMLLALSRFLLMIPVLFLRFHILSTSLLSNDWILFDAGYTSFLSATKHEYDVSNPIRKSFLQVIAPQGNSLFKAKPLEQPRPQSKMQRTRNRFWTCYMMSKLPQLQALRKSALATDAKST